MDSPPLSPITPAEGCDRLLFSGSFPIPSDPARLAERIRRSRSQMSAAYDDTEYEPYGLPEVVMKGQCVGGGVECQVFIVPYIYLLSTFETCQCINILSHICVTVACA